MRGFLNWIHDEFLFDERMLWAKSKIFGELGYDKRVFFAKETDISVKRKEHNHMVLLEILFFFYLCLNIICALSFLLSPFLAFKASPKIVLFHFDSRRKCLLLVVDNNS